MSQVPALAQLFRNVGYPWSVADELCNAIEALGLNGARSDDIAAALFRWRTDGARMSLGQARKRAERIMKEQGVPQATAEASGLSTIEADVDGQLQMFDTADERARLGKAFAALHGK